MSIITLKLVVPADLEYKSVEYHLEGRIPAKKDNQQIRVGKSKSGKKYHYPTSSEDHKLWELKAVNRLKSQKNHETIKEAIAVIIYLNYGDLRVKDNTNTTDSIHDALVKAKVLKDDSWKNTGLTAQVPIYEKGVHGATICIAYE